jgi:hypothetical protein
VVRAIGPEPARPFLREPAGFGLCNAAVAARSRAGVMAGSVVVPKPSEAPPSVQAYLPSMALISMAAIMRTLIPSGQDCRDASHQRRCSSSGPGFPDNIGSPECGPLSPPEEVATRDTYSRSLNLGGLFPCCEPCFEGTFDDTVSHRGSPNRHRSRPLGARACRGSVLPMQDTDGVTGTPTGQQPRLQGLKSTAPPPTDGGRGCRKAGPIRLPG